MNIPELILLKQVHTLQACSFWDHMAAVCFSKPALMAPTGPLLFYSANTTLPYLVWCVLV